MYVTGSRKECASNLAQAHTKQPVFLAVVWLIPRSCCDARHSSTGEDMVVNQAGPAQPLMV